MVGSNLFLKQCEEEKREENAIFRNSYLVNYLADFLKIWYVKFVYRGYKIRKSDRNQPSGYIDMRC